MSKSNQQAEMQAQKLRRERQRQPEGQTTLTSQRGAGGASGAPFDDGMFFKEETAMAQAQSLQRLGRVQSQQTVQHIGRVMGNQHVQRVITAYRSTQGSDGSKTPRSSAGAVQAKLAVSAPGDAYEQEADAVAEQVMRMPVAASPPAGGDEKGDAHSRAPVETVSLVQASGTGAPDVSSELETRIQSMKGAGAPLPHAEKGFFEERFGTDFSNVRLHTGGAAVQTSQDLGARAYTIGSDIAFGKGEYAPGTTPGRQLMAHELAHVVQQGGAGELRRQPDDGTRQPDDEDRDLERLRKQRQADQKWQGIEDNIQDEDHPYLQFIQSFQKLVPVISGLDDLKKKLKEEIGRDHQQLHDVLSQRAVLKKKIEKEIKKLRSQADKLYEQLPQLYAKLERCRQQVVDIRDKYASGANQRAMTWEDLDEKEKGTVHEYDALKRKIERRNEIFEKIKQVNRWIDQFNQYTQQIVDIRNKYVSDPAERLTPEKLDQLEQEGIAVWNTERKKSVSLESLRNNADPNKETDAKKAAQLLFEDMGTNLLKPADIVLLITYTLNGTDADKKVMVEFLMNHPDQTMIQREVFGYGPHQINPELYATKCGKINYLEGDDQKKNDKDPDLAHPDKTALLNFLKQFEHLKDAVYINGAHQVDPRLYLALINLLESDEEKSDATKAPVDYERSTRKKLVGFLEKHKNEIFSTVEGIVSAEDPGQTDVELGIAMIEIIHYLMPGKNRRSDKREERTSFSDLYQYNAQLVKKLETKKKASVGPETQDHPSDELITRLLNEANKKLQPENIHIFQPFSLLQGLNHPEYRQAVEAKGLFKKALSDAKSDGEKSAILFNIYKTYYHDKPELAEKLFGQSSFVDAKEFAEVIKSEADLFRGFDEPYLSGGKLKAPEEIYNDILGAFGTVMKDYASEKLGLDALKAFYEERYLNPFFESKGFIWSSVIGGVGLNLWQLWGSDFNNLTGLASLQFVPEQNIKFGKHSYHQGNKTFQNEQGIGISTTTPEDDQKALGEQQGKAPNAQLNLSWCFKRNILQSPTTFQEWWTKVRLGSNMTLPNSSGKLGGLTQANYLYNHLDAMQWGEFLDLFKGKEDEQFEMGKLLNEEKMNEDLIQSPPAPLLNYIAELSFSYQKNDLKVKGNTNFYSISPLNKDKRYQIYKAKLGVENSTYILNRKGTYGVTFTGTWKRGDLEFRETTLKGELFYKGSELTFKATSTFDVDGKTSPEFEFKLGYDVPFTLHGNNLSASFDLKHKPGKDNMTPNLYFVGFGLNLTFNNKRARKKKP